MLPGIAKTHRGKVLTAINDRLSKFLTPPEIEVTLVQRFLLFNYYSYEHGHRRIFENKPSRSINIDLLKSSLTRQQQALLWIDADQLIDAK